MMTTQSADEGLAAAYRREDAVLARTNELLETLNFGERSFARAADLVASVSSMSVALYEKLFQFRLRDVVRVPRTLQDYEHNAQLVVDALTGALLEPTAADERVSAIDRSNKPLTGRRLCSGDWGAILQLVERLEQVYAILYDDDGTFRGGALPDDEKKELEDVMPAKGEAGDAPFTSKKKASRLPATSTATTTSQRKVKRKSARVPTARRGTRHSSGSDGDSEAERVERPPTKLVNRRVAKSTSMIMDKSSSGMHSERKQTEIRSSGVVDADLVRRSRSVSRPSSSSSSSSPPSRGSSARRLAQSLVVEHHTQAADPLSKSTSSMQKRSRNDAKLPSSVRSDASRPHLGSEKARRSAATTSARHFEDSGEERALSARAERQDVERELLQTQKYGRFVGSDVAKPRSMRTRSVSAQPRDPVEPPPFGDLSSVSIASKGSRHFLDEGTGLEHDFSATSLDGAESSGPVSHESSDDDEHGEGWARKQGVASERARHEGQHLRSMNPNQQEAAIDDHDDGKEGSSGDGEDRDGATASPVRKKVARDEPRAPELSTSSRVIQRAAHAKSLHPLLSQSNARTGTSKAQAEYLRYKLTLKNHLQELLQVSQTIYYRVTNTVRGC